MAAFENPPIDRHRVGCSIDVYLDGDPYYNYVTTDHSIIIHDVTIRSTISIVTGPAQLTCFSSCDCDDCNSVKSLTALELAKERKKDHQKALKKLRNPRGNNNW